MHRQPDGKTGQPGDGMTEREGEPVSVLPSAFRARRQRVAVLAFLLFAFCLLPFAWPTSEAGAATQLMVNLEKGRQLFGGSCGNSYCHGSEGKGGGGPMLRDKPYNAIYLRKVISDGIAGTSMPGFKERFTPEQINQLTGYLLSLSPGKADPPPTAFAPATAPSDFAAAHGAGSGETKAAPQPTAAAAPATPSNFTVDLRGDARVGRELFFDSAVVATCRSCHSVNGVGNKVASDLGRFRNRAPRDILQALLAPASTPEKMVDAKYALITITLKAGEKITGIKRDESAADVRIYDTSSTPPISRSFLRSEIASLEKQSGTACPGNYASKYTLQQLLDLISFLKSESLLKPASVSVKELF